MGNMIFNERVMGDDDKKYNFDDYSKALVKITYVTFQLSWVVNKK